MSYLELVKTIPKTIRKPLSERLIDILLEAKEGGKVPPHLAKIILFYWQRDVLDSEAGLTNLLEAASEAFPDAVILALDDFGLETVKLAIMRPVR